MTNIALTLPADEDGFLSRECPTCLGRFKGAIVDGSLDVHYCPYCGHNGDDCWWTPEQLAYARAIAMQEVLPEIDHMMDEIAQSSGGLIKVTAERSTPDGPVVPDESGGPDELHTFACCGAQAKLESGLLVTTDGGTGVPTCPRCGAVARPG
jgi:NAD-dependent SIR2 family protein deacetylase